MRDRLLTFFLLLGHDGVAEGQQPEEGVDLGVLQLHRLHQGVVVEREARVGQRVEGEVHRLRALSAEESFKTGWTDKAYCYPAAEGNYDLHGSHMF